MSNNFSLEKQINGVDDWLSAAWSVIADYAEQVLPLSALCRRHGIDQARFFRALVHDEAAAANWAIARRIRAQMLADAAVDAVQPTGDDHGMDSFGRYTSNSGRIKRDQIRADVMLRVAGHLDPEAYGNRVINDNRGSQVSLVIQSPETVINAGDKKHEHD